MKDASSQICTTGPLHDHHDKDHDHKHTDCHDDVDDDCFKEMIEMEMKDDYYEVQKHHHCHDTHMAK